MHCKSLWIKASGKCKCKECEGQGLTGLLHGLHLMKKKNINKLIFVLELVGVERQGEATIDGFMRKEAIREEEGERLSQFLVDCLARQHFTSLPAHPVLIVNGKQTCLDVLNIGSTLPLW